MDIPRSHWRPLFLAAVLVTCVGCDQATKKYAVEHLQHTSRAPLTYFGDTLRIQYAENRGAFLSLGADWTPHMRFLMFTLVNAVVLPVVAIIIVFRRQIDHLSLIALSLIFAGGVGNLIDRITTDEAVVIDFLNVGIGWLRTGVFNVADMAITCGFVLLLPHLFSRDDQPVRSDAATGT